MRALPHCPDRADRGHGTAVSKNVSYRVVPGRAAAMRLEWLADSLLSGAVVWKADIRRCVVMTGWSAPLRLLLGFASNYPQTSCLFCYPRDGPLARRRTSEIEVLTDVVGFQSTRSVAPAKGLRPSQVCISPDNLRSPVKIIRCASIELRTVSKPIQIVVIV